MRTDAEDNYSLAFVSTYTNNELIFEGANVNGLLYDTARFLAARDGVHDADFDIRQSLSFAECQLVAVGAAIDVAPESERTQRARELFADGFPAVPSNYNPIKPEELPGRIDLEVGREYDRSSLTLDLVSDHRLERIIHVSSRCPGRLDRELRFAGCVEIVVDPSTQAE